MQHQHINKITEKWKQQNLILIYCMNTEWGKRISVTSLILFFADLFFFFVSVMALFLSYARITGKQRTRGNPWSGFWSGLMVSWDPGCSESTDFAGSHHQVGWTTRSTCHDARTNHPDPDSGKRGPLTQRLHTLTFLTLFLYLFLLGKLSCHKGEKSRLEGKNYTFFGFSYKRGQHKERSKMGL